MQVEIIERHTGHSVATYPVDLVNRKEPPTNSKCTADAWGRAVDAGLVDPEQRAEYDILVGVSFGYAPNNDVWPMTLLMGARSAAADATGMLGARALRLNPVRSPARYCIALRSDPDWLRARRRAGRTAAREV
jgi:hypothetical protein